MTNIVTPEQVQSVTGISVDAADIARAQSVIEIETGIDLSSSETAIDRWQTRDQRHLRAAVSWETAYLDTNPQILVQLGLLSSASVNGVSVTYSPGATSSDAILAPLAQRALARLSQRGSRSMTLGSSMNRVPRTQTLVEDEGFPPWEPLT